LGTRIIVAEHRNVPPNAITEIGHKSTFLSPQTRALVPKHKLKIRALFSSSLLMKSGTAFRCFCRPIRTPTVAATLH